MMDEKMRKAFLVWEYKNDFPKGIRCVEWTLDYLHNQQEPEFYTSKNQTQAVENGANRYVMAREARWVQNPTENDVALYTHPVPSAPAVLEEWRIALGACVGALMQCSRCEEPECKQTQDEYVDAAISAARKVLAASSQVKK